MYLFCVAPMMLNFNLKFTVKHYFTLYILLHLLLVGRAETILFSYWPCASAYDVKF